MTDRELLEDAARAAGISVYFDDIGQCCQRHPCDPWGTWLWSPLTDDGDALRLAVKCQIDVVQFFSFVRADSPEGDSCHQDHGSDPYAATRRAIVRAASALAEK
jgi:hypothetical protein